MLRLIIRQSNWGIMGAIFGFAIGFFIKIYLIGIVTLEEWGKYAAAQTFSSISETILSIGIPYIIIRFFPSFIENNKDKASRIANLFIRYALIIGSLFLGVIYFSADYINDILYGEIDGFSWILFFMCIHIPISLLFGIVISLYRSVLKIKEIVLYGTVVAVSLRAILTFIVFQYTSNIIHFILIEVLTQVLILFILLYLFNKNEFTLFIKSDCRELTDDKEIINYGKKMFLTSIIAFISGNVLSFIISIKLPSADIGAYNILLTLTGLTTFLLINLNKVFAPAISKLYAGNNLIELNELYKKTTFFINIFTIPLIVILTIFSDEILSLYTSEMLNYKKYLFFMLAGGLLSLAAGSSGTLMIMAGLEKQNLYIQFIRSILLIILSLIFIPIFGLYSAVILYVSFMFFVNLSQLIFIYKNIKISPFSNELIFLLIITFLVMYVAISQDYEFNLYHYIFLPFCVYAGYFLLMFIPLKRIIKDLL